MQKLLFTTIVCAIATAAMAQPGYKQVNPSHRTEPKEVFYLEGKYLDTDAEIEANNAGPGDDGIGGSRFVFGYQLYPQIALEIGWTDFDEIEESNQVNNNSWETVTEVQGYTLGAKGFVPIRDRTRLWAVVGYYFWDAEIDVAFVDSGLSAPGSGSYSGSDPYWGFGFDFLLSERAHFSIEYGSYSQDDLFDGAADASAEEDFIGFGVGLAF